jgi:multisubunit Na+/H+ antiporter MnhE subunit
MRASVELVCWWLALTAGYLMLVSSPTGLEVPVGVVIGGLAALVAVAARRAFDPPTSAPSFVRRVGLLPLDLLADAVTLTWLLVTGRALRATCGTRDEIEVEDDPAVRAWAVLLTSASPGSLAADVEERDGGLVLRRHLVTGRQRAAEGLASR